jgi:hypothetical protein
VSAYSYKYDPSLLESRLHGPGFPETPKLPQRQPGYGWGPMAKQIVEWLNTAYEEGRRSIKFEHDCCECNDYWPGERPCRYCAGVRLI